MLTPFPDFPSSSISVFQKRIAAQQPFPGGIGLSGYICLPEQSNPARRGGVYRRTYETSITGTLFMQSIQRSLFFCLCSLPAGFLSLAIAPAISLAQVVYPQAPVMYPTITPTQTVSPNGISVQVQVGTPQTPGYTVAQPAQGGYFPPGFAAVKPRRQNPWGYGVGQPIQGNYAQPGYPNQFGYPATLPAPGYPAYPGYPNYPAYPNYPTYPGYPNYPYGAIAPGVPSQTALPQTINQEWLQKLVEADRLYRAGQLQQAEKLFRETMAPLAAVNSSTQPTNVLTDPTALPTDARVYWEQALAAQSAQLGNQSLTDLQFLVRSYPQFVPGHVRLVQVLNDMGRKSEAMAALEQAIAIHPNQPDLVRLQVEALRAANRATEAAIAARRFALLNPTNPAATEFTKLADDSLKLAQKGQQTNIGRNILGGVLRGTLGYLLTNRTGSNNTSLPLSILQGVLSSSPSSTTSSTDTGMRSDMQQMLDLLLSNRR